MLFLSTLDMSISEYSKTETAGTLRSFSIISGHKGAYPFAVNVLIPAIPTFSFS